MKMNINGMILWHEILPIYCESVILSSISHYLGDSGEGDPGSIPDNLKPTMTKEVKLGRFMSAIWQKVT